MKLRRAINKGMGSLFSAHAFRIVVEDGHARAITLAVAQRDNPMREITIVPDGCYTPGRVWLAEERKP